MPVRPTLAVLSISWILCLLAPSLRAQSASEIQKMQDQITEQQKLIQALQDSIAAQMFVRKGDLFVSETLTEGDILSMPEIEVELPFAVFYAGLDFPDDDSAPVS